MGQSKNLDFDYYLMTKELSQLLKDVDNIYSWRLENRPLIAARNINELVKEAIEKSVSKLAKLEYRKDEFRLTKIGFIEFSLAEELEFRHWIKRGIRNLNFQRLSRYLLWLSIPKKADDTNLVRFSIWDYIILFLEKYSDFLDFKMGEEISEYEILVINFSFQY